MFTIVFAVIAWMWWVLNWGNFFIGYNEAVLGPVDAAEHWSPLKEQPVRGAPWTARGGSRGRSPVCHPPSTDEARREPR